MLKQVTSITLVAGLVTGCALMKPEETTPFGGPGSVEYSKQLWSALKDAGLAGSGSIQGTPYTGRHPHGAILDALDSTITVYGHRGAVIVKRNYGGPGVSKSAVANNPDKYLKAVTVMFKREAGYDSDNKNGFWAKYKPDGSLHVNPKKMKLAGRVVKGAKAGCIACHKSAPGGDYVFNSNRF